MARTVARVTSARSRVPGTAGLGWRAEKGSSPPSAGRHAGAPGHPVSGPTLGRGWARPSTAVALAGAAGRRLPASVRQRPDGSENPVSLTVVLTAFVLVLPVELPDKTLFASLVLATRFPPLPVFVGVGTAFGLQVAIAVTAGSLLSLLPDALVSGVVAVLFLIGAALLWRRAKEGPEKADDVAGGQE